MISTPYKVDRKTPGFSLIELVIVVVIIGIIGAIAIPRLSRGAEGADESALQANITLLNKAVEHYAAEHHGRYPDAGKVDDQLTMYTDLKGNTSATKTTTHIYGPYLRSIPVPPVEEDPGEYYIGTDGLNDGGWMMDTKTGQVSFNPAYTEG